MQIKAVLSTLLNAEFVFLMFEDFFILFYATVRNLAAYNFRLNLAYKDTNGSYKAEHCVTIIMIMLVNQQKPAATTRDITSKRAKKGSNENNKFSQGLSMLTVFRGTHEAC
jgi:hypothetical protein